MNILKHMEAAFLFSLAAAGLGSLAVEAIPPAQASVPAAVVENPIATPTRMAVVKVGAKRMNAAEKLQSLAMERIAGSRA